MASGVTGALGPPLDEGGDSPGVCLPDVGAPLPGSAEDFASQFFLREEAPCASTILQLADLLLAECSDRDARFAVGKSVSAGLAIRKGAHLRPATVSHPQSVRLVNRFISLLSPSFLHSSFVIIDGVESAPHRDRLNAAIPNIVLPISRFRGGELLIECQDGPAVIECPGGPLAARRLSPSQGPVVFNARDCFHTVAAAQDRRVVVAAYTLQVCVAEPEQIAQMAPRLCELGFRLPTSSDTALVSALEPHHLPLAPHQWRLMPDSPPCPPPFAGAENRVEVGCNSLPCQGPASSLASPCLDGSDFPGPAGPRLFLDLFAGARAPISEAMATFLADRFEPVDIIFGPEFDLLRDDRFELLCRVADSGLVGAASAAPVCSDHSVLRLKPGGPPPVRTPSELDGCLNNSWSATLSAQESSLLHDRTREVLSCVAASGGFIVLENPVSSLTFQDPLMLVAVGSPVRGPGGRLQSWPSLGKALALCV